MIGTIIGTGLAVASSLIGGAAARRAKKRAERELKENRARNEAWYNRRYNEDYLDTAAGQNLVRRAMDYANSSTRKAHGAAVVGGGTDVAEAQAKEAGNKIVGDTIANIAAADTARKDSIDKIHQTNEENYTQQRVALENESAQNAASVASSVGDGLATAGAAFDGGSSFTSKAPTGNVTDSAAYSDAKKWINGNLKL